MKLLWLKNRYNKNVKLYIKEKKNGKYPYYDHNVDESRLVIVSDMHS